MAKTGRPTKPYRSTKGEVVDGLYRCPDGRWRIVATGERFTQPNEELAILHFRQWQAKQQGKHADFAVPVAKPESAKLLRAHAPGKGQVIVVEQFPTVHRIDHEADDPVTIIKRIPEPLLFHWMREQLIARPKYCAEQTGIEQLGYLADLPKPTPSPTLDEVGELYFTKAKITDHWRMKSRTFWREFVDSVGVRTLREIAQELVADYKADVLDSAAVLSPTYAKHRFGQVKTIINYSKQWGKWADDRTRALAYCSILIPPTAITLDPSPIDPPHYHALLNAADDQMKAILLLALNACMYGHEVADVKWKDLDLDNGVMVADRGKTTVARVAVLWTRTIEAIRKLPRTTESLFITSATKQPHNANTIGKVFRQLRDEVVKLPASVKFCHVRDGAYTTACEGDNVKFEHARILGGHRTGMSDHYVKRRPRIVTSACEAIEQAYFG